MNRSSARRSGPTTRPESRGSSTTRATTTRTASQPSRSSGGSRAATRSSTRPGWARRPPSSSPSPGAGTTVAVAEGAYFGTGKLIGLLAPFGIRLVEFDQTGAPPEAEIVWVESPANPTLTLPNWDALREHPGLVVCDATISTPIYLRALDQGADIVVHSATKFLTGHHDALLGATVSRAPHTERLRELRVNAGITAAPDAAAALLRGLETLEARMQRHTESATEIAARLRAHPAVENVRYPGFSGLISFDVADARAVETSTKLIRNATSLGGVSSSMESRHRWEGDRIPVGLLRLSVGLEPVDELWADLEQALDTRLSEEPERGLEPLTHGLQNRCSTS